MQRGAVVLERSPSQQLAGRRRERPARKGATPPPRRRRAVASSDDDEDEDGAERLPRRGKPKPDAAKPEREDAQAVVKKRLGLKGAADVADAHAYCRAVLAEDAAPARKQP